MRFEFLAMVLSAIAGATIDTAALAQGAAFRDITGRWEAVLPSTGHTIELEIDPAGTFSLTAPRGSDAGVVKREGAQLVLGFTRNPGSIVVSRKGEALDGTASLGTSTLPVTFNRKK